jgi:hypothetical protein
MLDGKFAAVVDSRRSKGGQLRRRASCVDAARHLAAGSGFSAIRADLFTEIALGAVYARLGLLLLALLEDEPPQVHSRHLVNRWQQ